MSELTPEPTPGDKQAKRAGFQWLGAAGGYAVLTAALIFAVIIIGSQQRVITALSSGLTQQRDQFTECKNKPATATGCTTPVAAEPSVIVKQGNRGPAGLTGGIGPVGPQGPQGPQGPAGPPGAVGKPGLPGSSPACLLEPSRCIGATGADGKPGKDGSDGLPGRDGKDGADGLPGKDGKDGAQGEMGVQGPPGRGIAKTACVNGKWVITYSDGAQEEPQGSCETPGP